MTNGRLSRPERRALQQQDARYLALPLDLGSDPRSMAAHLRRLVKLLQDRTSKSPCADAAAHATRLYDRTVPDHPQMACRKGCSYCCTQDVTVTALEAFLAAAAVRRDPAAVAAVLAADEQMRGMTPEQRLGQVKCPLLAEHICSIYASRPLACHSFVSLNLDACIATFVNGAPPQIPSPQVNINALYTLRMMLKAAMRLLGLNDQNYEMTAAVAAILRTENAEKRWLAGENIFAQVRPDPPIPPQFDQAINNMAAHVAPTL